MKIQQEYEKNFHNTKIVEQYPYEIVKLFLGIIMGESIYAFLTNGNWIAAHVQCKLYF